MLITERQLKKIIKALLLEQGPDIPERPEISGSKFGVPVVDVPGVGKIPKTKFEKSASKIEKVLKISVEDAKTAYKRKLYSNDLTNKIREKIKDLLPDGIKIYTGMDLETILEYLMPKNRQQRFKNVTDKKDPYYLNGYPNVVSKIENKINNLKISTPSDDMYLKVLGGIHSKAFGTFSSEVDTATVNTAKFYNMHIAKKEKELSIKLALMMGELIKDNLWNNFDSAMRGTIFHEVSHAWDAYTQPDGLHIVSYFAYESLKRLQEIFPDIPIEGRLDQTKGVDNYDKDKLAGGSQFVKDSLKPVFKKEFHSCLKDPAVPYGINPLAGEPDPDYVKCSYLNLHSKWGQSEILTRIRQAKTEVKGSGQGVGKFTPENIKYIKDKIKTTKGMYGTVRYDVGQLFKKLRDDVSNQEIADAFNKVVPSG